MRALVMTSLEMENAVFRALYIANGSKAAPTSKFCVFTDCHEGNIRPTLVLCCSKHGTGHVSTRVPKRRQLLTRLASQWIISRDHTGGSQYVQYLAVAGRYLTKMSFGRGTRVSIHTPHSQFMDIAQTLMLSLRESSAPSMDSCIFLRS